MKTMKILIVVEEVLRLRRSCDHLSKQLDVVVLNDEKTLIALG